MTNTLQIIHYVTLVMKSSLHMCNKDRTKEGDKKNVHKSEISCLLLDKNKS